MKKLISVDFKSEIGFFKKPDINDGIYLTYNLIPKPVLLGIFGAILGLEGYKQKGIFPEFYQVFKNLKIGIEPLAHEKGNFSKSILTYTNTTGIANRNDFGGTNLVIKEQVLIKPSYRIYILLNLENEFETKLYNSLKKIEAVYLPYFGKNEFSIWWDSFFEYNSYKEIKEFEEDFEIKTIFLKEFILNEARSKPKKMNFNFSPNKFIYFERLPIGFHEKLFQYELGEFAYTNQLIKKETEIESIYQINENEFIQLF